MDKEMLNEILRRGVEESAVPLNTHLRIVNALNAHLKRQNTVITTQEQEIRRRKLEKGDKGDMGKGIKGDRGKVGKTGKGIKGDKGDSGNAIMNKETIMKIVDKTVSTGKIVDAVIEKIKKDKPIDVSHLNNYQSLFTMNGTKYKTEELMHGGGGITLGNIMSVLVGVIDNTNVTFTFKREPIVIVVNGSTYRSGAGVTITNTTAVLDNPVGTGGDIYALG